jgi:GNAT superfamily N-acetyltransferase
MVREATLDDVGEIVEVYTTNPDRPLPKPIEEMGICEANSYGGPWMSVESCAIHINNLLAWGYDPLVVEHEGKVIAETEFYIGPDVPPLGKTLDVSVIFVHSDFQRMGAGTLLMEEMISRAGDSNCDHVTVSGCSSSQGFYDRFGFEHLLELITIDSPISDHIVTSGGSIFHPPEFAGVPPGFLWIGRFLHPTQKWREIHDGIKRRIPLLKEHSQCPGPKGRILNDGTHIFVAPEWGQTEKADGYCWSGEITDYTVKSMIDLASEEGYKQLCLQCHPDIVETVVRVSDSKPGGAFSIEGITIRD